MNLIQIQERLKEFPLNAVIAYANGSNPDVPPYLALAEIQRRNKVEESSMQATAPDQSVKEQMERKALELSANQMMADQARQQQASQQMAQQMAQPQGQVPQGVPQPEVTETQPTYAGGGLTRLPVNPTMFNFDMGGIVSFAEGGTDEVDNPFKEEKPRARPIKPAARPRQEASPTYLQRAERELEGLTAPKIQSPQEAMAEAAKTNPSLLQPAGAGYEAKLKELTSQDEINQKAFEEREKMAERRNLWNSLIAAGEATRGGQGIGSLLGGFGRSYGAGQAESDERRARQEALRREQSLNMAKLNSEIENLRRAEARGDVEAQRKHLETIAKLEMDLKAKKAEGFKDLAQVKSLSDYYQGSLENQRRQLGQQSLSELAKNLAVIKQTFPNLTPEEQYKKAFEATVGIRGGEVAGAKLDAKIIEDINKLPNVMAKRMEMMGAKDPAKQQSLQAELDQMVMDEYNRRQRMQGGIAAPTAAPQGGGKWGVAEKVSQ